MIEVQKYSASWCGPCKVYAPLFNQASQQLTGKATFRSIDIDTNNDLVTQYSIRNVPTTIFLKNGIEVKRQTGIIQESQMVQIINSL